MGKKMPEGAKGKTIEEFVWKVIHGSGGFEIWEDRECVIHHWSREYSIAAFIVRALANPLCEGSEQVLNEIIKRRGEANPSGLAIDSTLK